MAKNLPWLPRLLRLQRKLGRWKEDDQVLKRAFYFVVLGQQEHRPGDDESEGEPDDQPARPSPRDQRR